MDINRAKEIINSTSMINVTFHGIPVYLQAIHTNEQTATVFPLDSMDHEQTVNLDGLIEQGPSHSIGGTMMNKMQAEEIAGSPDLKHVTYAGKRVYIQHVNSDGVTAHVYYLDDPGNEFDVPFDKLEMN